jgi:hypothetical protein
MGGDPEFEVAALLVDDIIQGVCNGLLAGKAADVPII